MRQARRLSMTEELLSAALPRLRRSLGLGTQEGDGEALSCALEAAEENILRYLNREALPEHAQCLLTELAALKYLRAQTSGAGKKSESYAEGQLSQSESYFTPEEAAAGEAALLRSLAPYRRVSCGERGAP